MKITAYPSRAIVLLSLLIAFIGVGCGGGGGGAPATYSVGGSVTGLINTGLVLQNNSSDDLSISTDSSFSFTTKLTTNTDYAVTVLTQPVDQTCSVTTGSGKVASSNITSVTVACTVDNQDAQGLYTSNGNGTGTFSGTTETLTDIKGMVYGDLPNQKFIFFDIATNVLYEGTITSITQTDFVGTAIVYHDGVMVDNAVTVSGTVTSRSKISMELVGSSASFKGSIEGLFSTVYDDATSSTRVSQNSRQWASNIFGSAKTAVPNMQANSFSIDVDGSYKKVSQGLTVVATSPSIVSCQIKGQLQIGEPKNIYIMSDETMNDSGGCSLSSSPNYTGFASVVAVNANDEGTEMWYAITNGLQSIFVILTRDI